MRVAGPVVLSAFEGGGGVRHYRHYLVGAWGLALVWVEN